MSKKIIGLIIGIILFIILILGISYAYLSAAATSSDINGTAASIGLEVDVVKTIDGDKLIPMDDDNLETALTYETPCIDKNGFGACNLYTITVTNTGNESVTVSSVIEFNKSGNLDNLKWREITSLTSIGTISNVIYGDKPTLASSNTAWRSGDTIAVGASKTYYIVVWISNIESNQEDTDNGKYNATITFYGGTYNSVNIDYTGTEYIYNVPKTGTYKLEVWGAQGGITGDLSYVNYGGYSSGYTTLTKDTKLYVNVGEYGHSTTTSTGASTSYNGGGAGGNGYYGTIGGTGGGGATHIALVSGLLSSLSNDIDKILIVAGGGGGAYNWVPNSSAGGGFQSNPGYSAGGIYGNVATQTTGYQFGQGQNGISSSSYSSGGAEGNCGGGGGFYGGYSLDLTGTYSNSSAAGGSGYIANSLLVNKVMYCYSCTESSLESTKTISTTNASSDAISNYAKKENGYAKITYIGSESQIKGEF